MMFKAIYSNARAINMICHEQNPQQIMTIAAQKAGW